MLRKFNKNPAIISLRGKLPSFVIPTFDRFTNFVTHVVYERWYLHTIRGSYRYLLYRRKKRPTSKKRILGLNDFSATDLSFGMLIEHQVKLLCEAHIHGIEKTDFAFVYNPEKPSTHSKYAGWVTRDNFDYHFMEIFPVLRTNPKLGSVFIFNSRDEFETFLEENKQKYIFSPSIFSYANNMNVYRGIHVFFRDFFEKYGFLPKLSVTPLADLWAKAFMKKYAKKYAVVVNLRNNPLFAGHRNAQMNVWKEFFEYCNTNHPDYSFIILGRVSELPDTLRGPNVIFAKEFRTNAEQDLALIQNCLFYMGVPSGPLCWSYLRDDIPFFVNSFIIPDSTYNYTWMTPDKTLPWQNAKTQKFSPDHESFEMLKKEFERLTEARDKAEWRTAIQDADDSVLNWPFLSNTKK